MAEWLPTTWLDKINDSLRKLSFTIDMMDRLERCGADCQEIRAEVARLTDMLNAFKTNFFVDGTEV